jgi:hypothetical protein
LPFIVGSHTCLAMAFNSWSFESKTGWTRVTFRRFRIGPPRRWSDARPVPYDRTAHVAALSFDEGQRMSSYDYVIEGAGSAGCG